MTRQAEKRFSQKGSAHWDITELGYKYNMSDIQAAILLPQIPKILSRLRIREGIAEYYNQAFSKEKEIGLPEKFKGVKHARHLYTIWVNPKKRDLIVKNLKNQGIGVTINYQPIHLLQYYQKKFI